MTSKRLGSLTAQIEFVNVLRYVGAIPINLMQDKQKVTLYLPPDLHRELKIRAAVEADPMSTIAERAIAFYLHNSEAVDEIEAAGVGSAHQVYSCPECASSIVLGYKGLVSLNHSSSLVVEESLPVNAAAEPLIPAIVS